MLHQRQWDLEISQRVQRLRTGPAFGRRAAGVVLKQPDGNMHVLTDPARKVVTDCRNPVRRFRRDDFPRSLRRQFPVLVGFVLRYREIADFRLVGRFDFLRSVLGLVQPHAHIRLPAAQPHVAH